MPATTIAVPLNTTLADLDETLRLLLREELGRHGFDGVQISFDAPAKEWAAALSTPTVNLFLYDLREAVKRRPVDWKGARENGRNQDVRPPLRLEVSYAVTAWTRTVEDEHRLLSQVLGILFAHQVLPEAGLVGTLANGSQPYPLETTIGQPRTDGKADFWSAVGGEYKASLDYVVLAACPSGVAVRRGPDVQAQAWRFEAPGDAEPDGARYTVPGTARWEDGAVAPDAWIVLVDRGESATADAQGRFILRGVPSGQHRMRARSVDGTEAEGLLDVPGSRAEVVLPRPSARASSPA
jgi:hypothetical protein